MPKPKKKPTYRRVNGRRVRVIKRKRKQRVPRGKIGYLRTGGLYGRNTEEKKYLDTAFGAAFPVTDAWQIVTTQGAETNGNVQRIPQGTGPQERIGLKVVLKSVQVRFTIDNSNYANPAPPARSNCVRLVCFIDTQTNGAIPTIANLWEADNFYTMPNIANAQRFTIVKEWLIEMNNFTLGVNEAGFAQDSQFYATKWNKKLDLPWEYGSTTGAFSELRTNSMWFAAISTGDGVAKINGIVRLRYTDM